MVGITFDKEKVSINIARLKKEGINFEVAIDADLAIQYKKSGNVDLREVLKSEDIFFDVKKGELASESEINRVLGTTDNFKAAELILQQGDIQLTSEYRQKLRDEKKNRILAIIQKNGIDPRTKLPHPMTRLENAFNEIKVHIDEIKPAEDQIQDVLRALQPILPIKFEKKKIQVHIPAIHAAKCYSTVKNYGEMTRDEWQNDGSWICVVELPAGMIEEFFDKMNKLTHGEIESKEL